MAPSRRVTERMSQLVALVVKDRPHPSPLPGWVGGIWWPRQRPHWCATHTHTHTERSGATQAGPTIIMWDTVSPSLWRRRGCEYVCVWVIPPWTCPPPPFWERQPLLAISSPWWLHCCFCSSKLERFTSSCAHNTCAHTEPTGGRPCSAQQASFKG